MTQFHFEYTDTFFISIAPKDSNTICFITWEV